MDDLIGYTFADAGGMVWRVTGPAFDGKLPGYVEIVDALGNLSVRDAQQLRRHRQLSRQEEA